MRNLTTDFEFALEEDKPIKGLALGAEVDWEVEPKALHAQPSFDPGTLGDVAAFDKVLVGITAKEFFQLCERANRKIRATH